MRKVRIPQPYARELKKEIKKNQRNIETQGRRLIKELVNRAFKN